MATDQGGLAARFEPRYFASVEYYARMAACGRIWLDTGLRYDKRNKAVHRTVVADTRGPLTLTVPVARVRPGSVAAPGSLRWSDVTISAHGDWWNVHRVTLESAYGRTPFFEFYIDRFLPFFRNPEAADEPVSVVEFDTAIDAVLRDILLIDGECVASAADPWTATPDAATLPVPDLPPYWQVRADRFGFIPGMSVLDLIFSLGPEAALYLRRAARPNL